MILKRIKNLWKLSELEVSSDGTYQVSKDLILKPKMAQIIKRENPIEEFLEQNGTK